MEALGKINCKSSISIIERWIENHKDNIIQEKQFFVLNHARIVLSKLTKGLDTDALDNFNNQFEGYLKNYYIL